MRIDADDDCDVEPRLTERYFNRAVGDQILRIATTDAGRLRVDFRSSGSWVIDEGFMEGADLLAARMIASAKERRREQYLRLKAEFEGEE